MPYIDNIYLKASSYLLFFLFAVLSCLSVASAQQEHTLAQLDEQLEQGELENIEYLNAVAQWINKAFAEGTNFNKDSLIALLSTFRDIAFGDDMLPGYRINYYIHLSNNANYGKREGESIYFLEKAEQEITKSYGQVPLLVAGHKCNTYIDRMHYANVVATYESVRDYLYRFPSLIRDKEINLNIAASFINVLHPTAMAYANLGDAEKVREVVELATNIHDELSERIPSDSYIHFTVNFYMASMRQYRDFKLLDNRELSHRGIQAMASILTGDTTQSISLIEQLQPVLLYRSIWHFLHYQENDSAAYYLDQLKSGPAVLADHHYNTHRFESTLYANQGQYEQAYAQLELAIHQYDSIQAVLVNDIDELLYAHTEAEYNRDALIASEKVKRQQLVAIFGILLVSTIAIATIVVIARRRNLAARARIEKLNAMAAFHIQAMEEIREQTALDEQKRLGRDLHDGLSSVLAGIKYQVASLIVDHPQTELASQLNVIHNQIGEAYRVSRDKSHAWYHGDNHSPEFSFQERVKAIMDVSLPDTEFEKEIYIDEQALNDTPIEMRIELLRIVHEAITNIIKHARATWVSVLLYREDNSLLLIISDDGKGLKGTQSEGMGIRSMRDRAVALGGTLQLTPRNPGSEVVATIPLTG